MPNNSLARSVSTPAGTEYLVGVDVGRAVIRAGVYTASFGFVGKVKLSTKPERGSATVIERICKCVRYVVDECDFDLSQVKAIGVGVPSDVTAAGVVCSAPDLGWEDVPLQQEMGRNLSLPIFVENVHNLGTLGIYSHEALTKPHRFAALFLGPKIGGGWMVDGALQDATKLSHHSELFHTKEANVFAIIPGEEFRHFRARDFRRAIRRGNRAVEQFVKAIAARAGQLVEELAVHFAIEQVALGGGLLEEMKEEILQIVADSARVPARTSRVELLASRLGETAGVAGGAVWAAQRFERTRLAGTVSTDLQQKLISTATERTAPSSCC